MRHVRINANCIFIAELIYILSYNRLIPHYPSVLYGASVLLSFLAFSLSALHRGRCIYFSLRDTQFGSRDLKLQLSMKILRLSARSKTYFTACTMRIPILVLHQSKLPVTHLSTALLVSSATDTLS